MVDLSVQIGGVRFKNPIFVAAGTFGYGTELKDELPIYRLGAIVTKSLTLEPLKGNPPPRIWETPCGLLNSIGLENIGVERFLEEKLPELKEIGAPIVVSIAGTDEYEYERLAEVLDGYKEISSLEVNVSCPNVKKGGIEIGRNPRMLRGLVKKIKGRTKKPLWVKITPNFVDVIEEARAAIDGGADALTASNTFLGMAIDVEKREFRLNTKSGGLSGPAIHPMSLYIVYLLAQNFSVPIIASGGASDIESTLDFVFVGARAVQIGTASFSNPRAPLDILQGIEDFMGKNGISSLEEIRGLMLRKD